MDYWLILVISLLVIAFFSGVEIAFLSSNKFKIELENKQGMYAAKLLAFFVKSPSRFICTILVGFNIALVIYSLTMESILGPVLRYWLPLRYQSEATILVLQTIISTTLILVTGEFLPKVLFRINPNQTLSLFSLPIIIVYALLFPIVYLILLITHLLLRTFFRIDFSEDRPVFGRVDLDQYIEEVHSGLSQKNEVNSEIKIFQNALDFTEVKVRECMIPRTEIISMKVDDRIDDLKNKFIETGLSRIMIYKDSPDYIIGFTHSSEMFRKPESIQSILLPILIVPETFRARELLTMFTQQRKSVALVVDEYGMTSGIITMEDIMEEIFGEIDDEHDIEDLVEGRIDKDVYVFSGRLEIDYINQKYNLDIPVTGDYETLAGFIFHHHENIPEKDEQIIIPPFLIQIQAIKGNRIEQVKLTYNTDLN
jgi:putative hemolysin